jgi:predicted ferric reductase
LQVGFYISVWWKQAIWVGVTGGAMAMVVKTRVLTPLQSRRRPYELVDLRQERGNAWTIVLAPKGHPRMQFAPGQFAWVTFGSSPFSLQQHPFSFSSSAACPNHLAFTIKALGDFTATVGDLPRGSQAYLEGPYGAFTPNESLRAGVFIVGGVGITPIMSMLRTFRDRGERSPFLLLYGNRHWEDVLFRDELAELEEVLNLTVVHVLSDAPETWSGESGRITPAVLDRYIEDPKWEGAQYFVCGPPAMMDVIEPALRQRGAPLHSVFSERFQIV